MPSKSVQRRARNSTSRLRIVERETPAPASMVKLFDIGPYDRNQLTLAKLNRLRELVDQVGGPVAAERVGVGEIVLYRVCAGFAHRLRPETAAKVRAFLDGGEK